MLLVPIGFGIIIGNIPLFPGLSVGIYEEGSVLNILYYGVIKGFYPPLIFLGIGAMTDFSALISNPKLLLIGAAAQLGIFGAYTVALALGFSPAEAGAIGIIGGADGPTAIFLSSRLAPDLMGPGTCDPASYHEAADHQEGETHQDEAAPSGIPYRKEALPYHRLPRNCIHRALGYPSAGYALLR